MNPEPMTPDQFREYGRLLIDWIADYWERLERLPVQPEIKPGDIRALLPAQPPEHPEPFTEVIADLDRVVAPGLVHWQSPNWFAFFPANASFPSILAELVSAGLGQQGMLWSTSPVMTEIETHVLDWFVDLLDLPRHWKSHDVGGGVIQMSASDSTHTSMVVGRERARAGGASVDDMVAYTSAQAHSSIEKGAKAAGFRHVRLIDVDDVFAMQAESLRNSIASDRADGLVPVFVASTIGTTGTTAVDPVAAIAEIARREDMWHHVDAAFAGTAMLCPEFRHHQQGLADVDSYTFNPHKWMATNFDCSVFYVADRRSLTETLSIVPPYLRNTASESGGVIDYRDWHISLGRRFRALKLWWVLRTYGAEGLRALVREHVGLARKLEQRLTADPRFEVIAPTLFSLVSFRHTNGDDATGALAQAINDSGAAYVTPSAVGDMRFIRIAIGQTNTRRSHVDALWDLIDRLAPAV